MKIPKFEIRRMITEDSVGMQKVHTNAVTQTCAALLEPKIVEAWLQGRTPEGYVRAAKEDGEVFWVAVENTGAVVGFASWLRNELLSLYVDPLYERRGVGRKLFTNCEADAQKCGKSIRHLNSTRNAKSFYESLGFRATRDGFNEKNGKRIPHTEMERS